MVLFLWHITKCKEQEGHLPICNEQWPKSSKEMCPTAAQKQVALNASMSWAMLAELDLRVLPNISGPGILLSSFLCWF